MAITKIQKKIVRTTTFSHYLAHTEPIFDDLNILNFNNLVVDRSNLVILFSIIAIVCYIYLVCIS